MAVVMLRGVGAILGVCVTQLCCEPVGTCACVRN